MTGVKAQSLRRGRNASESKGSSLAASLLTVDEGGDDENTVAGEEEVFY